MDRRTGAVDRDALRLPCDLLDLTLEFCRAAEELNAATGLSDRVRVLEGSATDPPFDHHGFHRAYSENVAMNIDDKALLCRGASRALLGAAFAFPLRSRAEGEPDDPLPWAQAGTSFLRSPEEHGSKSTPRGPRS